MRTLALSAATAAALLVAGPLAMSQTSPQQVPTDQTAPGSTRTVNLTAEQNHVIKEIVLKDMKVDKASGNLDLTVGSAVPSSVATHAFPPEISNKIPQVKSHKFFVKDDQVVVVDPKDNKITEVIR
jgi:CO/xanthine dehydrogenase Mo-binding subunit